MISLLIKNILLDNVVWCFVFCEGREVNGFLGVLFLHIVYTEFTTWGKWNDSESVSFINLCTLPTTLFRF